MDSVITTQPVPTNGTNFTSLTEEVPAVTPEALQEEDPNKEEEKEKKMESRIEEVSDVVDCCCSLDEDDWQYDYFCIQLIANCFVSCGQCTDRCLTGCCESICCNDDAADQPDSGQCCDDNCCDCGDVDCCDCGDGDCCDCFT